MTCGICSWGFFVFIFIKNIGFLFSCDGFIWHHKMNWEVFPSLLIFGRVCENLVFILLLMFGRLQQWRYLILCILLNYPYLIQCLPFWSISISQWQVKVHQCFFPLSPPLSALGHLSLPQRSMPVRSAMEVALPRLTVKEPPQETECACVRQAMRAMALCASVRTIPHLSRGSGLRVRGLL